MQPAFHGYLMHPTNCSSRTTRYPKDPWDVMGVSKTPFLRPFSGCHERRVWCFHRRGQLPWEAHLLIEWTNVEGLGGIQKWSDIRGKEYRNKHFLNKTNDVNIHEIYNACVGL